jgi:polygalacturonase
VAWGDLPRTGDPTTQITVTVGQGEADFQGTDDKSLQGALDYVARLGGGVLHILPGEYSMRNALHLHSKVTVRGSGENTVLKKTPSVRSKLSRDSDWYERVVYVEDPAGFSVGGGVMLQSDRRPKGVFQSLQFTIVRIDGNALTVHKRLDKNFWLKDGASSATLYPLIRGERVNDVRIEGIVLDGNREENEEINGNYAGAIFMQWCDDVVIDGVTCRNYNGDGISLQVCDDPQILNTTCVNNANLGLHPGSGTQRPVYRNCVSNGNGQGFFFCWGVMGGLVEDCEFIDNVDYGISVGHRDTDNTIRNCRIVGNRKIGVYFRKEETEFFGGHRNVLENCEIMDNGADADGVGIDIRGETHDLIFRDCKIGDTGKGIQKIGIRIGPKATKIEWPGSSFVGLATEVERAKEE